MTEKIISETSRLTPLYLYNYLHQESSFIKKNKEINIYVNILKIT